MNQRLISVLAFALIVSAGASFLLYRLLGGRAASKAPAGSTKLVLAARTLQPGTLVKDADLKLGTWMGAIPEGALQKQEDVVGRGVIYPIFTGEPMVESRMARKGGGAGLAALIPKGMRAVAIRVNEIVGVAGFAVPGMRVDVLVSGTPPGATGSGSVTRTLLQNVQVLSAGQNFQKDVEGKPISVAVVNLLVTPEQAEMLSLASTETSIQLVLRNPLDTEIARTNGSAITQILHVGGDPPNEAKLPPAAPRQAHPVRAPAALPPPPKPRQVEVIHGVKRAEIQFESRDEVKP
jgi:pilus assembly protein CpaB